MDIAHLVLDFVKVILSTPVIVGAVALLFLRLFRKQIGGLVDRLWRIKFPGGELSASQQEKSREVKPAEDATKRLPEPNVELPATIKLTPEQGKQIGQLIQSERANAVLWEYRYLNLYLVQSTQFVLDWLARQAQPVSLRLVDSNLQVVIPEASERTAIFRALESHRLITVLVDAVEVTPKGREYIEWRRPLPATGPA